MTPTLEFPGSAGAERTNVQRQARTDGSSWKRRSIWWLLAPLVLFLPLPLMPHALFFGNRDSLFYANVLAMTSDALRSGSFHTQWFADANASMGSPVMMFYAPLGYVATALFEWPLDFLHLSLDAKYLLGIYLSQVLSGFTAFLWLKRRFSPRTAFIGSLHYVLLPYKFIYIYGHMNLAQLWALVFLPLWMLGAEELIAGRRMRGAALFALAGGATYYSHPLTVIAFGAVPAVYALWFGKRRFSHWAWLTAACALMGGVSLALAWPQHHNLSWISPEGFLAGKLAWRQNLHHVDLLLCAWYGFIAGLVALAAKRCRGIVESGLSGPAYFFAGVIGIVAFLNLHLSEFIWERISLLQYLQFPAARLHSVALIAVIFLICIWLDHYPQMLAVSRRVYKPVTIAVMMALALAGTGARLVQFYDGKQFKAFDIAGVREARIISPPEYRTRWGCVKGSHALELYQTHAVPARLVADGGLPVSVQEWNPPDRIAFTAAVQPAQTGVTVRQCYIPAWQAYDSGKPVPLSAGVPDGLIHLSLSPGTHKIEIRLAETADMRMARRGSMAATGFCLALFIFALSVGESEERDRADRVRPMCCSGPSA